MSYLADSIHSGALVICAVCTRYAKLMRSPSVVLIVVNCRPRIVMTFPGVSGLLGLMVATSNAVGAFAAIGFGGVGIGHAVSGVARLNVSGTGFPPCVKVPTIELPSALTCPSYVAPMGPIANRKVEP